MKLYTGQGDDGTTSLGSGARVSKNDLRVGAYGEVDEANAVIGLAIAWSRDAEAVVKLRQVQSELLTLGSQLAHPEGGDVPGAIGEQHCARIEEWIDAATEELPPVKSFVLPGGAETAAGLHYARTVCRRAERAVAALAERESVSRFVLVYLNRLSDYLFALARQANHRAGVHDMIWMAPEG